ncbi:MAG: SIS domain-containing protein [Parachlamydiales bacterium]|nr:SIS domain-containing protein [Parachlamydiales bacterium]
MDLSHLIAAIDDGVRAINQLKEPHSLKFIQQAVAMITDCYRQGGKLLIAGNGGSLCDASHFAEEMTGIFRKLRPALPAIAFSEPGHLTCIGNDLGYDKVFSRAVEAYGKPEDIFIGLTTSGNSGNLIAAFEEAKKRGIKSIAFLGKTGGKCKGMADLELIITGFSTSDRIQEAHMTAIHIIIEFVENALFTQEQQVVYQSAVAAQ